jgi:hypothetical protein
MDSKEATVTNSLPTPRNPQKRPGIQGGSELPLVTDTDFWNGALLAMPDEAKIALLEEIIDSDFGGNASAFSKHYGFNRGLTSRAINHGYIAPAISRAMGWPIKVEVMPCTNPDCEGFGEPHVWDCQTEQVKPKPTPKRPRQPRLSIDQTRPELAARSILRNTSSDYRQELVRLLLEKERVK